MSSRSHAQLTWGRCSGYGGKPAHPEPQLLGSPPPVVPPLRGSRRGGAGVHARPPRPASCLPTRTAGLDKARRFNWLRCASGQRLQPYAANGRLEMQIKLYKRGGAVCGRKKRSGKGRGYRRRCN